MSELRQHRAAASNGENPVSTPAGLTVEGLAALLREAEAAHGAYERQLGQRDADWPTWYARYVLGRLQQLEGGEPATPA